MNTQIDINKINTIVKSTSFKGTSFVGIRNYENQKGERSNQTILVGFTYFNHLEKDLQLLSDFDINTVVKQFPNERLTVLKGYNELLTSLVKRTSTEEEKEKLRAENDVTIAQSDAQLNAYTNLGKGLNYKDDVLYIKGLMIRKTVIGEKVEYPKVNSALKTIIKRKITKQANLKSQYFRTFILPMAETLKTRGFEIPQN
jgi:hypothetical protein